MENIKEINLSELAAALLKKAWLIVVCAIIAGGLTFAYTANFITPLYRSSVKIYVNNRQSTSQSTGITSSDLATSQRLVATYINILRSDTVLQKVANTVKENHNLDVSASSIRGMMSADALGETEVFEVYISNANPEHAAIIANAVAEVAPDEITYFVEGSSTKIVDYATPSRYHYTPNKTKNTAIGMLVGAIAAACFIVLQTLLDVRIKNEEDLAALSKAPVLGMIPDLTMEVKGDYSYREYRPMSAERDTRKGGKA